jgi:hypothetical protein
MTDEIACPWPGCTLEEGHKGDHLTAADDGLLPDEMMMVTRRSETIREVRFAAGDDAAGAAVVAMALVGGFSRKSASNGSNITATAEVDPAYSEDFRQCMGEQTFILRVEGTDYGECQVMTEHSWTDIEARVHTRVLLKWANNQWPKAKPFGDFVSKTEPIRMELWQVQIPVFGAKAE